MHLEREIQYRRAFGQGVQIAFRSQDKHLFVIRGKIDGLQDNGATLVEVKNRRNRVFDCIPVRERVQMEVYMRMPKLALEHAVLVQHCKGTHMATPYKRDDRLWDRVIDGLRRYAAVTS